MTAVTQGPRKVAIIGGGIAGLCAAVYAAQSGYQVEVLEQHSVPGGLATSWSRGEYTFETCLHWLVGSNPKGTLHEQWREVFDIAGGIPPAGERARREAQHLLRCHQAGARTSEDCARGPCRDPALCIRDPAPC